MRFDVCPSKPLSYLIDKAGDPGKMVAPDLLVMVGEKKQYVSEESIVGLGGEGFTL